MTKRVVLLPVFAFLPLNNGGTFRLVKLAKFLPEFGWEPIVVAPEWNEKNCYGYGSNDNSMIGTETCEVIRVPFLRTPKELQTRMRSNVNKVRRLWGDDEPDFGRLPLDMLNVCSGLLRTRKIDAIFASSLPRFLHKIASCLHQELGIPWIADHRDIVDQEGLSTPFSLKTWLSLKSAVFLESVFTRNAAAITTVSEPLKQILQLRNRARVYVIMNGFDPDDFDAVQAKNNRSDQFRIVYCGSFFGKRDPSIFLDGVDLLCRQRPDLTRHIQVWFYGKSANLINDYVLSRPCKELIHSGGIITHRESLQRQAEAQVVYLISHPSKGIVTGKIFEYINAGAPILSVPGDGDVTDRIISETNAGIVCRSGEEVFRQLIEWISHWERQGSLPHILDKSAIAVYTRRNQASQLAALLNNIV